MGDEAASSGANGVSETSTAKIKTWLAISGGVIGLLAFFGISNFDQLKHALFAHATASTTARTSPSASAADATACHLEQQAAGNGLMFGGSTVQWKANLQAESDAFANAASVAVNQELKADLENAAYTAQQSSQTFATDAGQQWIHELGTDMETVITYCLKRGY